jgi:hypothetical protein
MAGHNGQPLDARENRRVTLDSILVQRAADSQADPSAPIPVTGHAAVFNRAAWIGPPKYGFSERFAEGSFTKTIKRRR